MMEFLASIGILILLLGGFYLLLSYSIYSDHTSEYELLLKKAHWENYFWSWCQDPINVPPKTDRRVALKKFFTKERIKEAEEIIAEDRYKKLKDEIKRDILIELNKKDREGTAPPYGSVVTNLSD